MNTFVLKRIDPILSLPMGAAASCAARLFHGCKKKDRPLVLRPGGLGDLILLCIAMEELRLDPQSFEWLIENRSKEWADYRSLDYVCYDLHPLASLWKIAGRFPIVINTEQRFGLSQAAAKLTLAKGGKLFAFSTNRGARFANDTVPYDPFDTHETIEFSRLLIRSLNLEAASLTVVARKRNHPASEKPMVGLGGVQAPSRSLNQDQWLASIQAWKGEGDFYISSSPQDASFARSLAEKFHGRAQVVILPFLEVCRLLQRTERVLTIDSGFLHLASYYGVPTTAIFTSGRDKKWRPLAAGSEIVKRSDLSCQPCTLFGQTPPCPYRYACKELDFSRHKIPL